VAEDGLAEDQKKAKLKNSHIVLIDESGLMLAPLLRRTWSLRGHPPELRQEGGSRQKVSVSAALCISPRRHRLKLLYQTLEKAYFNNVRTAEFLKLILRRLPGDIIVIWDGGTMHKGDPIRRILARHHRRLSFERLPPYAPMLNPVEQLWGWLKYGQLNNFATHNTHELNRKIVARLNVISRNQPRLRAFFRASKLPL
jgi:putative transposase